MRSRRHDNDDRTPQCRPSYARPASTDPADPAGELQQIVRWWWTRLAEAARMHRTWVMVYPIGGGEPCRLNVAPARLSLMAWPDRHIPVQGLRHIGEVMATYTTDPSGRVCYLPPAPTVETMPPTPEAIASESAAEIEFRDLAPDDAIAIEDEASMPAPLRKIPERSVFA